MKANDSTNRLKTYKIKNHDSGKTYTVKAVSYTDAVKKYNKHILKDSITEDADAFIKETIAELSRYIRNWDFMSAKERNNIMPGYSKSEGLAKLKIKLAELQANQGSLSKDSITEDAGFSNWLDKTAVLEVKPQIDAALSSFKKGGHSGTKYDDYSIYLFASFGPDKFELRYYYSTLLEKAIPSVINDKTSIVSDLLAKFNRITGANAKLEKTGRLTSRGKTEFLAKAESTGKRVSGNEYAGYTPRAVELMFKKEKIDSIFKDSITEDADIAQNDIKSSYLPEDANADNIQYLGFNEKRKLSFYSYGDRYFVHHDLEGRTEEIDKETVQKILKKNILGEIDENDLINKEPQSEEIVSDAFEDAGEISIKQFDPKRLVESSKNRKQALHNEIRMKNGDVYTVFFQASGEVEKPRSIWVSIVLDEPSGQQSRVLSEKAETYEQAIQIMNDWKKKQERGDK